MSSAALDSSKALTCIAFGSCLSETKGQGIWNTLAGVPEFASFRAQTPLMTTWGDHDYGANDAEAYYPFKKQAEQMYLDAWMASSLNLQPLFGARKAVKRAWKRDHIVSIRCSMRSITASSM